MGTMNGNDSAWIPYGSYKTIEAAKQAMKDIRKNNERDTYGKKWQIYDTKHDISSVYTVMDKVSFHKAY